MNQIYVEHTGQTIEVIEEAVERDRYMDPNEAREFGLIDEVVVKRPAPEDDENGDGSAESSDD